MFFSILVLLNALIISGVAAYYSILGLTAIFAAAFWPIVIMGVVLEAGKISATLWLHYYWDRASFRIKAYLVPAVVVLMFLTSMGVFGLLSKSHSDQTLVTSDVVAQLNIIDEKIKIEQQIIDDNRQMLAQLDNVLNQFLGRTDNVQGVERSLQVRRAQTRERSRLTAEIEAAQKKIAEYRQERAPIAAQTREVEAKVGPIKYIAAMIYGEEPDYNSLEAAVRWVIVIIVIVFDPLAIVLLLAATSSLEWSKAEREEKRRRKKEEELEEEKMRRLRLENDQYENNLRHQIESEIQTKQDVRVHEFLVASHLQQERVHQPQTVVIPAENVENVEHVKPVAELTEVLPVVVQLEIENIVKQEEKAEEAHPQVKVKVDIIEPPGQKVKPDNASKQPVDPAVIQFAVNELIEDAINSYAPVYAELMENLQPYEESKDLIATETPPVEKDKTTEKVTPFNAEEKSIKSASGNAPKHIPSTGFGVTFPQSPHFGDLFVRVDYLPTKLYRWNGIRWIEIDKNKTSSYVYDETYISYLVDGIGNGQYSVDDLTELEQEQVAEFLRRPK